MNNIWSVTEAQNRADISRVATFNQLDFAGRVIYQTFSYQMTTAADDLYQIALLKIAFYCDDAARKQAFASFNQSCLSPMIHHQTAAITKIIHQPMLAFAQGVCFWYERCAD